MASAEEWQEAFKELEPQKQESVKAWINTQMFIARELGMQPEKWFEYVEWAFQNPFDFEFAAERGEQDREAGKGDAVDSGARAGKAAAAVGSKVETKLPGAGGPGNLLNMVIDGKKDREGT
jgi:hypothetical protein